MADGRHVWVDEIIYCSLLSGMYSGAVDECHFVVVNEGFLSQRHVECGAKLD